MTKLMLLNFVVLFSLIQGPVTAAEESAANASAGNHSATATGEGDSRPSEGEAGKGKGTSAEGDPCAQFRPGPKGADDAAPAAAAKGGAGRITLPRPDSGPKATTGDKLAAPVMASCKTCHASISSASAALARMNLPVDDPRHMPPKSSTMSAGEIAQIKAHLQGN